MTHTQEFRLVQSVDPKTFEQKVNAALAEGFFCHGFPFAEGPYGLVQAMLKHTPISVNISVGAGATIPESDIVKNVAQATARAARRNN